MSTDSSLVLLLWMVVAIDSRRKCWALEKRGQLYYDFNARVGRSVDVDDVVGMFGEDTCSASGNRLISFLNEVELVECNSRKFVTEPEWTRVRPSLKQKSIRYSVDESFWVCACK